MPDCAMVSGVLESLSTPALISISAIAIVLFVVVVALCACYEDGNPQPKKWMPRKATVEQYLDQAASNNTNHAVVDIEGEPRVTNGILSSPDLRENGNSRVSTLGRQLPDLPPGTSLTTAAAVLQKDPGIDDDYDHLRMAPNSPSRVNPGYDHCTQSPVRHDSRGGKSHTKIDRENIYNLPSGESSDSGSGVVLKDIVREPIYELLSGETSDSGSGVILPRENVYNEPGETVVKNVAKRGKVAETPTPDRDSDYTLVKDVDVDPYAHISNKSIKSPNKVTKSKKPEKDPYAVINIDRNSFVDHVSRTAKSDEPTSALSSHQTNNAEDDEYATVAKFPDAAHYSPPGQGSDSSTPGSPLAPPLPGRQYTDEDVASLRDRDSLREGAMVMSLPPADDQHVTDPSLDTLTSEVSYTEVTARESLASVQARQREQLKSQNTHRKEDSISTTYETVIDNFYSTVEGGSGDGFVVPRKPTDQPARRNSDLSDTYAEIHASGGSVKSDIIGASRENVEGMVLQGAAASANNTQIYAQVYKKSLTTVSESPHSDVRTKNTNSPGRRVVKSTPAPLASAESVDLISEFAKRLTDQGDPNYESLDDLKGFNSLERRNGDGVVSWDSAGKGDGAANAARGKSDRNSDYHEVKDLYDRPSGVGHSSNDVGHPSKDRSKAKRSKSDLYDRPNGVTSRPNDFPDSRKNGKRMDGRQMVRSMDTRWNESAGGDGGWSGEVLDRDGCMVRSMDGRIDNHLNRGSDTHMGRSTDAHVGRGSDTHRSDYLMGRGMDNHVDNHSIRNNSHHNDNFMVSYMVQNMDNNHVSRNTDNNNMTRSMDSSCWNADTWSNSNRRTDRQPSHHNHPSSHQRERHSSGNRDRHSSGRTDKHTDRQADNSSPASLGRGNGAEMNGAEINGASERRFDQHYGHDRTQSMDPQMARCMDGSMMRSIDASLERRVKSVGHTYEEVLGRNGAESAYDVRKRVLQKHVYEVVSEASGP